MIIQIVRRQNGTLEKSAIRLHINSAALITKRNSVSVIIAMPSLAIMLGTVLNTWKACLQKLNLDGAKVRPTTTQHLQGVPSIS